MPQMSPMWWSTLFFIFIMTLMTMTTMNYFTFKYSSIMHKSKNMKKIPLNWTW